MVRVDDDLVGGKHGAARASVAPPQQTGRLAALSTCHGDDTEHARVEPARAGPPGDIAGLVGVVAHQHRLRPVEYHLAVDPDPQVRSLVPASRSGSICSAVPTLSSR